MTRSARQLSLAWTRRAAAGVALLAACCFAPSAMAAKPLQIMLLGDSITAGQPGTKTYRYYLWKHLVDADLQFDFVGTRHDQGTSPGVWPLYESRVFDPDHEGHHQWRIDHIINGKVDGEGDLTTWLDAYTPDIAVVLLGTHDALQGQPTEWAIREMRRVIETLRRDNEKMGIILACPPPSLEPNHAYLADLSIAYDELAERESNSFSPVVFVDLYHGFDRDGWLRADGITPAEKGEQFVADQVAQGILRLGESHLQPLRQTSAQAWGSALIVPLGAAIGFMLLGRSQLRRERSGSSYQSQHSQVTDGSSQTLRISESDR